MKRLIFALIAMITMAAQQPVMAQSHRSTPRTAQKAANDTSGIEAFSDTSSVGSSLADTAQQPYSQYQSYQVSVNPDDAERAFSLMENMFDTMAGGMLFALAIIVIIFVIAPLAILFLIFYFIYKYRKQKLQLAETAMKNGQPIPNHITEKPKAKDEDTWKRGVEKMFLGLGIIACCWVIGLSFGIAAGCILFFYGLGLMVIAKTTNNKTTPEQPEDELKMRDEE